MWWLAAIVIISFGVWTTINEKIIAIIWSAIFPSNKFFYLIIIYFIILQHVAFEMSIHNS